MGGEGGKKMSDLVQSALSRCPGTKIIVSGYSQGAMVVHSALRNGVISSQIGGAVLFGDPLKRSPVGDLSINRVKQFCGTSDFICGGDGDGGATGGHISYGAVADAAATFAIQAAGLA
jgi:cutinase